MLDWCLLITLWDWKWNEAISLKQSKKLWSTRKDIFPTGQLKKIYQKNVTMVALKYMSFVSIPWIFFLFDWGFWGVLSCLFRVFFESAGSSLFINCCYCPRTVPWVYNGGALVVVMYLLLPKAIKVMKGLENSELCLHLATLKKLSFLNLLSLLVLVCAVLCQNLSS